jgi:hypothetical protein
VLRGYFRGPQACTEIPVGAGQSRLDVAEPGRGREPGVAFAHMRGHVVIAGLGMGLALYNAVLHPAVRQITVLECDSEVVVLFAGITGRGWPESGRFSIERVDARDWRSPEPVDFLYVDIRDKVGASEAAADTRTICRNLRPKSAGYWGMEADFVSFLARKPLQAAGDASTVSGLGACASVCLSQPTTVALGSRASRMSQPS